MLQSRSAKVILALLFGASNLGLLACKDPSSVGALPNATSTVSSPAPNPSVSASVSGSTLAPLDSNWLVRLELNGFGKAVVAAPTGATKPRPLLIGVHGIRDRPEWACGELLGVTRGHPFILCPHGSPRDAGPDDTLGFFSVDELKREIDAGILAVRARFGAYIADGPMIYAGFSRGAFFGVSIVANEPGRFPVVVLGEGGQTPWTTARANQFARGGGKRVLFVCSTPDCEALAPPAVATLKRAGVEAKMISAGHLGHIVDDRIVTLIRGEWPWVVGDRMGELGPW